MKGENKKINYLCVRTRQNILKHSIIKFRP
ncbi:hypothetical protein IMSAGC008_01733 [Muribaculaceae bacterium]|nr:hypothetical protein IMSAGC008_01733 [Muribaculaceae bacterium]